MTLPCHVVAVKINSRDVTNNLNRGRLPKLHKIGKVLCALHGVSIEYLMNRKARRMAFDRISDDIRELDVSLVF